MFTATSVYALRVVFAWPRCCNRMFGQRWRHWMKMRHFSVNVHIFLFLKTLAKFWLFWLWNHLTFMLWVLTLYWRERNFVSDRLPGFLIPLHTHKRQWLTFHLYRQSWALLFFLGFLHFGSSWFSSERKNLLWKDDLWILIFLKCRMRTFRVYFHNP